MADGVERCDLCDCAARDFRFQSCKIATMALVTAEAPHVIEVNPHTGHGRQDTRVEWWGIRRGRLVKILEATPFGDKETSKEVGDAKRCLGVYKGLVGSRNGRWGYGVASEREIGKREEDVAEDGICGARGEGVTKIGDDAQFERSVAGMGALKEVIIGFGGTTCGTEGTSGGVDAAEVAAARENAMDAFGCERGVLGRLTENAKGRPVNAGSGGPLVGLEDVEVKGGIEGMMADGSSKPIRDGVIREKEMALGCWNKRGDRG